MKLVVIALSILTLAHWQTPVADWPASVTTKKLYAKTDLRGKAAPKLEVEQWLTGKAPDIKKKVVILDFWATWCPPCRATIPDMNKLAAKFKDDVVVIGVSDETSAKVTEFRRARRCRTTSRSIRKIEWPKSLVSKGYRTSS